jgi:hypothetical protein
MESVRLANWDFNCAHRGRSGATTFAVVFGWLELTCARAKVAPEGVGEIGRSVGGPRHAKPRACVPDSAGAEEGNIKAIANGLRRGVLHYQCGAMPGLTRTSSATVRPMTMTVRQTECSLLDRFLREALQNRRVPSCLRGGCRGLGLETSADLHKQFRTYMPIRRITATFGISPACMDQP